MRSFPTRFFGTAFAYSVLKFSCAALVIVCASSFLLTSGIAFAETAAVADASVSMLKPIGAALAISLSVIGGGIGLSRVGAAALESISRNPGASGSMFLAWILGFVLIESMVILAFVIANQILG